jgi:hypothetical protein
MFPVFDGQQSTMHKNIMFYSKTIMTWNSLYGLSQHSQTKLIMFSHTFSFLVTTTLLASFSFLPAPHYRHPFAYKKNTFTKKIINQQMHYISNLRGFWQTPWCIKLSLIQIVITVWNENWTPSAGSSVIFPPSLGSLVLPWLRYALINLLPLWLCHYHTIDVMSY